MSDELKRFVRSRTGGERRIKVFLETHAAAPDEAALEHLRGLGFEIEKVVGNKVLGSVESAAVDQLEADPLVRTVELSRRVGKHRG